MWPLRYALSVSLSPLRFSWEVRHSLAACQGSVLQGPYNFVPGRFRACYPVDPIEPLSQRGEECEQVPGKRLGRVCNSAQCRVLSADRQSMIWLRKRRRNGLCDLVTFKAIGAPIRRRERNDRHHRFSAGTTGTMGYPTWYANNCARRHMNDLISQPMITFTGYHIEQFFAVRVNMQRVPLAWINSYHS